MADEIDVIDEGPKVVGTPEGDNEFAPDEPLKPLPDDALLKSPGGAPDAYRQPESKA